MLLSISLILLVGLSFASLFKYIRLPRVLGMLLTGIILGPSILNLISNDILNISSQLREIALIIILIKAGLTLNLEDLKKVGRPALLLSFLPALFEFLAITLLAPYFFGFSYIEAALLGSILAAVSPAVVIPKMVQLIEDGYGKEKSIPQMILAGASLDDVFVIVLFTTFLGLAQSGEIQYLNFLSIPVSIVAGVGVGLIVGFFISKFFSYADKKWNLDIVNKSIILLCVAFIMISLEDMLENYISFSALLAIMSMAIIVAKNSSNQTKKALQNTYGKIWIVAEVFLFVLVGASVNLAYIKETGFLSILLIIISLFIRSIGVYLALLKTPLNIKERIFVVLAYLPKATVQAAIGGIPLSVHLACGETILSVAVMSILFTAPLGAIGMDLTYKKFLKSE